MPYGILDDHFDEHPKIVRAGGDAAWLHVCGILYCRRNLTGGVIPKAQVPRLSDRKQPMKLAARLVTEELWEDHGENYHIHDYAVIYDQEESQREARREKAKKAATARWSKAQADAPSNAQASDEHSSNGADAMPSPSPSPLGDDLSLLVVGYKGGPQAVKNGDSTSLRERLEMVCTGESAKRRTQAPKVLEMCQRHVSDQLIDEAIGYLGTLRKPPEYPVYLLKVISQWGPQRGIAVPDLAKQWEQDHARKESA